MLIRNAQVSGQDITIYETDKGDFCTVTAARFHWCHALDEHLGRSTMKRRGVKPLKLRDNFPPVLRIVRGQKRNARNFNML